MDGFNYIISGKYGSQTTNVIEKITGRKPLRIVRLIISVVSYQCDFMELHNSCVDIYYLFLSEQS